jgi:hypothetical protein
MMRDTSSELAEILIFSPLTPRLCITMEAATINTTTTARFTDELGGQTYANDIVLDWSTWNGSYFVGVFQSKHSNWEYLGTSY